MESLLSEDFDLSKLGFDDYEIKSFTGLIEPVNLPNLDPDYEPEFYRMAFFLSFVQQEMINDALDKAKAILKNINFNGEKENNSKNGNALELICETFLTQHGKS